MQGTVDFMMVTQLNQILKEAYNQNMKDLRITIDVNPNNMIWDDFGDGGKNHPKSY